MEVDVFPFVPYRRGGVECSSSFGGGGGFEVVDAGWVVDIGGGGCVYVAEGFVVGGGEVDGEGGACWCSGAGVIIIIIIIVDVIGVGRDCSSSVLGL